MEEQPMESMSDDQYGTKEVHAYYLPVMDDLHSYCMSHQIKYSLSGGTLLGAIRHKGFIPWDDDVDVMFDRPNYEKFLEVFSAHPMEGYEIVEATWVKRLSRVDNPLSAQEEQCIDLFVFDEVPSNAVLAQLKIFFLQALQGMLKEKPEYERFSLKYKVLLFTTWLIGRFITRKQKQKIYDRISKMGQGSKKVNVYNTMFNQIKTLEFDKSILSDYEMIEFEGRKYMTIQGYDHYLTELYGDYMQLPPEEKRCPPHRK